MADFTNASRGPLRPPPPTGPEAIPTIVGFWHLEDLAARVILGLIDVDAALQYGYGDEHLDLDRWQFWKKYLSEAYDVIAEALFKARALTTEAAKDKIPAMVFDVAVAAGWTGSGLHGEAENNHPELLKFGSYWASSSQIDLTEKHYLANRIAYWSVKAAAIRDCAESTVVIRPEDHPTKAEFIGERIDRLRKAACWTVRDLADKTGLSPSTVQQHISDHSVNLRGATFIAYGRAFGITPDDLRKGVKTGTKQVQNRIGQGSEA